MEISLRPANKSEFDWINHRYQKIGFSLCNKEKDTVLLAEVAKQRVGFGRLIPLSPQGYELAGIFVVEPFRHRGIATRIVKELIKESKTEGPIYCIAFSHLISFYKEHRFIYYENQCQMPKELKEKFQRCRKIYQGRVELLIRFKT